MKVPEPVEGKTSRSAAISFVHSWRFIPQTENLSECCDQSGHDLKSYPDSLLKRKTLRGTAIPPKAGLHFVQLSCGEFCCHEFIERWRCLSLSKAKLLEVLRFHSCIRGALFLKRKTFRSTATSQGMTWSHTLTPCSNGKPRGVLRWLSSVRRISKRHGNSDAWIREKNFGLLQLRVTPPQKRNIVQTPNLGVCTAAFAQNGEDSDC
jgi:hypothetical protein